MIVRLLKKAFHERRFITIRNGQTRTHNFSVFAQILSALTTLILISTLIFTTSSYITKEKTLHQKEQKIQIITQKQNFLIGNIDELFHNLNYLESNKNVNINQLKKQQRILSDGIKILHSYGTEEVYAYINEVNEEQKERTLIENEKKIAQLREQVISLQKTVSAISTVADKIVKSKISKVDQQVTKDEKILNSYSKEIAKSTEHLKLVNNIGGSGEVSDDFISPVVFETEKQAMELQNKITYHNRLQQFLAQLPTSLPLKDYFYISSSFGYRVDPFSKRKTLHKGLDFAVNNKSKVYLPLKGVVSKIAVNKSGYGLFVEVTHSNKKGAKIATRYGHLAKVLVKRGQHLKKGDVIALTGSTGRSTGPHLHYEILYNNIAINPFNFIKEAYNVYKKRH